MSENRSQRVGHQIRSEISELIQRGFLKDPRIGFVSISGVRVTRDIGYATVYTSVYGTEKEGNESIEALQKAASFIRKELGKRLRIRRVPELTFVHDRSIEEGIRMGRLIDDAIAADTQNEPPSDSEEEPLPS